MPQEHLGEEAIPLDDDSRDIPTVYEDWTDDDIGDEDARHFDLDPV